MAMQKACEATPSTMAAIIALPDEKVEEICAAVNAEGEEMCIRDSFYACCCRRYAVSYPRGER